MPTSGNDCEGFICECDSDDADHDEAHPCPEARCYHCGWEGVFPPPSYDPKKLTGWARTAYAAGWRPPVGWVPKR